MIERFHNNILGKQVSNIMFRDDSFIAFVNPNIVCVYLNTIAPKEIPFYLTLLSLILGLIFQIKILVGVGIVLALLYFMFQDIIFLLFKIGLRKKGFSGKIEAL